MVERVVDGQKRVFQHPKKAELTDKGHQYLKQSDKEDLKAYQDISHRELVEKVRRLEHRVDGLDRRVKVFRKQVERKLSHLFSKG
jgi:hypothetical protein